MGISCSSGIFNALEGLTFPADKRKIISHACARDAAEAVVVGLNRLEAGVEYGGMGHVCENLTIVCSVEVYDALAGIEYPADKRSILTHARFRGATELAMAALGGLVAGYVYESIGEICRNMAMSADGGLLSIAEVDA